MEKKKKRRKKKKLDQKDKILLVIFFILLVLVIILSVVAFGVKHKEKQQQTANVIIPIMEKTAEGELGIDISKMKKDETKEYTFIISNYKQEEINKEEIQYNLIMSIPDSVNIKIYKNDQELTYTESDGVIKLEANDLKKNKKSEDTYRLEIKTTKDMTKKSIIDIKIENE